MSKPATSLIAFESLSETGLYARELVDDLTTNHQAYTHTISAIGGFDAASFNIGGTEEYLKDWFDDGLMRRIVYFDTEGIPVWEGYVNRLNLAFGTSQKTKTVENVINRVYLKYSPLDLSALTPVALEPTTLIIDDVASQAKFGVKATVINGGEQTDEGAFNWARVVLGKRSLPQIGENINLSGSGSAPALRIECRGYFHTLKWIPYEANEIGKIQAHQVIQEILEFFNSLNPGWISTNFGWMDFNFRQERRGADELKTCWSLIEDIIKRGGLGGERWVAGLYQDRLLSYKPAEDLQALYRDALVLTRSLNDPAQRIFEEGFDAEIKPWNVVPDRILRTVDI